MPVGDENVAVRRDYDSRRVDERVRSIRADARFAERQQDLSLRTELENLVAFSALPFPVGRPHVSVAVHMETMGIHEHARAKAFQQLP
jgi:hypothetical protein